jgi:hypothetical protein
MSKRIELHAQDELALEVLLGPGYLFLGYTVVEGAQLVEDDRHGLGDGFFAGAEIHSDHAGVRVERRVRVHGVGEPTLVSHFLEEA